MQAALGARAIQRVAPAAYWEYVDHIFKNQERIGTLNFDNRSLALNNESNLVVLDEALGAQMDSIFVEDLRYSKQIELAAWRERGGWARWANRSYCRALWFGSGREDAVLLAAGRCGRGVDAVPGDHWSSVVLPDEC